MGTKRVFLVFLVLFVFENITKFSKIGTKQALNYSSFLLSAGIGVFGDCDLS